MASISSATGPSGHSSVHHASARKDSLCTRVMRVAKALFIGALLLTAPTAGATPRWDCPTPQGSYLDSCRVSYAGLYQTSDLHLVQAHFCEFQILCQPVGSNKYSRRNTKFLPHADIACGSHWENCNGHLVARQDGARHCTSPESIKNELAKHRREL